MSTSQRVEEPGTDRRARWELIILVAMYGGYAAMMLCRNTLGAASAAMIQDPSLGLDKASYGELMAYHSVGAILGKLVTGVAADKLGGRTTFLLTVLLTAVATFAFGMMSTFFLFAALNFAGQFFKAGGWPAMAKVTGDWYPPGKFGRVWSIISTSSRVGTITAGVLVGAVISVASWQWAFVVTSGIALVSVVVAWFWLKAKPADVGLSPPRRDVAAEPDGDHPLHGTTLLQGCVAFVKCPRVWLICGGMVLLTALMDFIYFIPIYLTESLGVTPAAASVSASAFPAGMFAALIVSSVVYDRFSKRQLTAIIGGLLVLCCLCAGLLWAMPQLALPGPLQVPAAVATIFVLGFAVSPAYYLPMSIFAIAFGGKHSGFLIALIDIFGYLGSFTFNFFGGSVAQDHGWPVFLGGLMGVAVLAVVAMTLFLHLDSRGEGTRAG